MSNVYYVNSQNLIHGTLMDVEAGICFTSLDSAIFYIGTKCGEISKRFGKKDYDTKVNIYNSDMSDKDIGYDIGPKTIKLFTEELKTSKLVLWNGPLGKYEDKKYENGTKKVMQFLKKQKFNTILAGGDITGASKYFNIELYYVSTGGGSTLEYLEGKKFKTLERLNGTDK